MRALRAGAPAASDPTDPRRKRRRRRLRIALGAALALLVALAAASLISVPYYALTPGTALQVGGLIGVPKGVSHPHHGAVLLTDVDLVPLRALDYLFFKWNSADDVLPSAKVTGPVTSSQYDEQGTIDMASARTAATVVALHTLGYPTAAEPDGIVDYQPVAGSPGAAAFVIGDVITALNGAPTPSFAAIEHALSTLAPGDRARFTYHFLGSRTVRTKTVVLGAARGSTTSSTCVKAGASSTAPLLKHDGRPIACVGLYLEQLYEAVHVPFAVSIDSEGIIGPSAGLAFTLGLLEKLDPDDLTGGRRVAATGTMSITGAVGDVGGVAQKTVAVEHAGATVFFVPPPEYAVAKAHATPSLKVIAVSSLSEAVHDLEEMGGRIGTATAARS